MRDQPLLIDQIGRLSVKDNKDFPILPGRLSVPSGFSSLPIRPALGRATFAVAGEPRSSSGAVEDSALSCFLMLSSRTVFLAILFLCCSIGCFGSLFVKSETCLLVTVLTVWVDALVSFLFFLRGRRRGRAL